jgi:SAM-dependent methyltransferase
MDHSALESIDWEKMWEDGVRPSLKKSENSEKHWNELARKYDQLVAGTEYADEFIARMKLKPDFTVLDIACGPGTLAIPLAKCVKSITALDQSEEMLQIIREKMVASGIHNITGIHKKWEDTVIGIDIEPHDIVTSSRYIDVPDLRDELQKLNNAALKYVYLTATADNNECFRLYRKIGELIGKPFSGKSDYIYYYNILYQLGIQAHVDFIYFTNRFCFESVDTAFDLLNTRIQAENAEQKDKFMAFLKGAFDKYGELKIDTLCRWALIWWPKEGVVHYGQEREE